MLADRSFCFLEGKPSAGHFVHCESREAPVYQLVVTKQGKMKLAADQTPGRSDKRSTIGGVSLPHGASTITVLGTFIGGADTFDLACNNPRSLDLPACPPVAKRIGEADTGR